MPKPKIIPFAPKLRLWPETITDIETRLLRFLTGLRRKRLEAGDPVAERATEPPPDEDNLSDAETPAGTSRPRLFSLSDRDKSRIRRRACALVRARQEVSGTKLMRSEDIERLRGIAGGVELQGPRNEHQADELAAQLLDEMPWHAKALEILWRDLRRGAGEGWGLWFRPLMLDGAPGVGKTRLALRLAELAAVPYAYVDVATSPEGFNLSGAQRTWSSASPGRPVATILESRVGNPILFVDELDKGQAVYDTKGRATSAHLALLSLLEPASAKTWTCPFFQTTFDMSHANWILAGNDARQLSAPLRSRLRVVPVRGPTYQELLSFAARELARRGLDEGALDTVERLIRAYPEDDERLNLRSVIRIIEDLTAIAETVEVRH